MTDHKCYCTFCVNMRHNLTASTHDYDYGIYDDTYENDDSSYNLPDPNDKTFAPFMLTIEQYDRLVEEYDHLVDSGNIVAIDRDDTHVIGKMRSETHTLSETHEYMVLQDITDLDLRGLQNAWFTTSGKILYVPWYSHNITAAILGHTNRYADELESMGWYHYSIGFWRNRHNVKVTDRMYDAIAKFADQNDQDAAIIAFGRK